jgi:hypothetical protein
VSVYVPELITYIVLAANVHHEKLPVYTTLVGTQLVLHNLVYAVSPGVPSPKSAYMTFASLGFCSQKSAVKNPHHSQLALLGVKICDAPRNIPIIAKTKTTKA